MDKKHFFFLLNNSFKITIDKYPDSIFYVWNKSIERQLKYNRLFNINKQIKYEFNRNDVFFEQKKQYIWCDYDNIYLKLKENIHYNKLNISDMIEDWLKSDNTWKKYTIQTSLILYDLDL